MANTIQTIQSEEFTRRFKEKVLEGLSKLQKEAEDSNSVGTLTPNGINVNSLPFISDNIKYYINQFIDCVLFAVKLYKNYRKHKLNNEIKNLGAVFAYMDHDTFSSMLEETAHSLFDCCALNFKQISSYFTDIVAEAAAVRLISFLAKNRISASLTSRCMVDNILKVKPRSIMERWIVKNETVILDEQPVNIDDVFENRNIN